MDNNETKLPPIFLEFSTEQGRLAIEAKYIMGVSELPPEEAPSVTLLRIDEHDSITEAYITEPYKSARDRVLNARQAACSIVPHETIGLDAYLNTAVSRTEDMRQKT